jgi:hypothetical protein
MPVDQKNCFRRPPVRRERWRKIKPMGLRPGKRIKKGSLNGSPIHHMNQLRIGDQGDCFMSRDVIERKKYRGHSNGEK